MCVCVCDIRAIVCVSVRTYACISAHMFRCVRMCALRCIFPFLTLPPMGMSKGGGLGKPPRPPGMESVGLEASCGALSLAPEQSRLFR